MSKKKLFSLILAGDITVAPGTKIIKKKAFSKLLSTHQLMKSVQVDAQGYKKQIAEECEVEREKARAEGFAEGLELWTEQLALLEQKTQVAHKQFEGIVAPVALKAAQKIVGKQIALDESTVVDIVANSLRAVSQHKKVNIYVNPQELDLFEKNRPKLKEVFERLDALTIQAKEDVKLGGCVVETEAGIINAEIENQWALLAQALEAMVESQ